MIRLLLIGRDASAWQRRLAEATTLELDAARLPVAGVRKLDETPPDAVVLFDAGGASALASLVAGIRNRPLGQLTPILVVAPPPGADADELAQRVDAWLAPDASVDELLTVLAELFELEVGELRGAPGPSPGPPAPPSSGPPAPPASGAREERLVVDEGAFFLEELPEDTPRRVHREDLFAERAPGRRPSGRIDETALKQKLQAVRHQDYFAILEVGRGAETPIIREAFHLQAARFASDAIDFDLAHRYQQEILEIRDALEDAWAVLGDPRLRAAYLEHTTRA